MDNIIHDGQLIKSNNHSEDDQMEMMMMMTAMMQMSKLPDDDDDFPGNDVVVLASNDDYQNPHHHHHHFMSPPMQSSPPAPPPPQQLVPTSLIHHQAGLLGRRGVVGSGSSSMGAMREMIFRIAVMQPVNIDPESVKAPKRRNVRISKDPQSVAARHRRERISERIRILQRLVPGGTKMDTASMLDEAIHYVKFLKTQLHSLQRPTSNSSSSSNSSSPGTTFLKGHFAAPLRFGDHHMLD